MSFHMSACVSYASMHANISISGFTETFVGVDYHLPEIIPESHRQIGINERHVSNSHGSRDFD